MTTKAPSIADIQFEPEAVPIAIKLNPEQVSVLPGALSHDTFLWLKVGERRFDALVPTDCVAPDHRSVLAARVGKAGRNVIVVLPTSNEGTPIWHIPEAELPGILAD